MNLCVLIPSLAVGGLLAIFYTGDGTPGSCIIGSALPLSDMLIAIWKSRCFSHHCT